MLRGAQGEVEEEEGGDREAVFARSSLESHLQVHLQKEGGERGGGWDASETSALTVSSCFFFFFFFFYVLIYLFCGFYKAPRFMICTAMMKINLHFRMTIPS